MSAYTPERRMSRVATSSADRARGSRAMAERQALADQLERVEPLSEAAARATVVRPASAGAQRPVCCRAHPVDALVTQPSGGTNRGRTSTPPSRVAGWSLAARTATSRPGADST